VNEAEQGHLFARPGEPFYEHERSPRPEVAARDADLKERTPILHGDIGEPSFLLLLLGFLAAPILRSRSRLCLARRIRFVISIPAAGEYDQRE
jgi:hypothetical protein